VVSETAVPATRALNNVRFFVERTSAVNTGFAAMSPDRTSTLTLELRNTTGAIVATASRSMTAGEHFARFIPELFPDFSFGSSFTGSLTVRATAPVAIVALRTIVNQSGDFLMTTLPVADLSAGPSTGPLYVPQIADRGGYVTEILLVNPGNSVLTGTAEFAASDGSPLSLSINGTEASSIAYRLEPHGTQVLRTAGGSGAVRTGYVVLRPATSTAPVAGAVFTYTQGGLLMAATGVSATTPARRLRFFFDRTTGHDTGFAIVNASDSAARFELSVRFTSGSAGSRSSQTLSSRNHMARFVSQALSGLSTGTRGFIEVSSDAPIAMIALRSTVSGTRTLLSTIPVEDLDVSPPAGPLYFPHRAQGGGFSTEFILMNRASGVAAVQLLLTNN